MERRREVCVTGLFESLYALPLRVREDGLLQTSLRGWTEGDARRSCQQPVSTVSPMCGTNRRVWAAARRQCRGRDVVVPLDPLLRDW